MFMTPGSRAGRARGSGGGSGLPWWRAYTPSAASMTIVSGDGTNPTLTDDADVGLLFDAGAITTGDKFRSAERTIANPNADWTFTVRMEVCQPNVNYSGVGIYARDSSGGKILMFSHIASGLITVDRFGSISGTYSANALTYTPNAHRPKWLRIKFTASGAVLTFSLSVDGKTWVDLGTENVSTYITNNPTRVGFGTNYNRTSGGVKNVANVGYLQLTP